MCSILSREPFSGFDLEKILALDRWYVANVLLRPRDGKGNLIVQAKGARRANSPRGIFFEHWRALGLPDHRIQELFDQETKAQREAHGGRQNRRR